MILLLIFPFPHHLYADFAEPLGLAILGQVASYSIAPVAVLITLLGGLSLIHRSDMRWTVPSIFIALGFWGWAFGGMGAILDSTIPINQVMHNTMWVPAHFHTYYLLGVVTFVWAFLYYLVNDLSGRKESASIRKAAWLFGLGAVGFLLMFYVEGAEGVPRRYSEHIPSWSTYAKIAVPFVLILIFSIGWIAIEILRGLRLAWQETENES